MKGCTKHCTISVYVYQTALKWAEMMCLFWMVMRDVIQSLPTPGYLSNFPSLYVLYYHRTNQGFWAQLSSNTSSTYIGFRKTLDPFIVFNFICYTCNVKLKKLETFKNTNTLRFFSSLWTETVYPVFLADLLKPSQIGWEAHVSCHCQVSPQMF